MAFRQHIREKALERACKEGLKPPKSLRASDASVKKELAEGGEDLGGLERACKNMSLRAPPLWPMNLLACWTFHSKVPRRIASKFIGRWSYNQSFFAMNDPQGNPFAAPGAVHLPFPPAYHQQPFTGQQLGFPAAQFNCQGSNERARYVPFHIALTTQF
ncbi:hypothetical protein IL306_005337 [Fusarium sp. DS 682]|nr:hypothetical protein IL306_005337 [Fusarium sp. DS 682]